MHTHSTRNKGLVYVGLSGGVDSSVSAYLLQKKGYTVVGVFIKVWQPDFLKCRWEEERLDAMRVAAHLGIPFLTCDAEEAYKQHVADHFIAEYKAGRTPNPDVMCNSRIKFGAFYDFARARGADYIATGHYAQIEQVAEELMLTCGLDSDKDQSYFLWNAPETALRHTLFPVGGLRKSEVRAIAASAGLPTAEKRDSQGICFLGHVDIYEFLSHYMAFTEGNVLNEAGQILGTHRGSELYTVGQRHGFQIERKDAEDTPYFVVARDILQNTITVAPSKKILEASEEIVSLHSCQLFTTRSLKELELRAQMRYRGKRVRVEVVDAHESRLFIKVLDAHELPAEGQSCVLLDGNRVLGGGIIGKGA